MKRELEAAMCETVDTLVCVIHAHADTSCAFVMINFHLLFGAIVTFEQNLEFARFIHNEICGFVLISESMTSDDDRFLPAWDKSRDILDNNRLTENCTIKNISDGAIRTFPHLLQLELLHSRLIRGNRCTFNSHFTLFDSIGSVDGNLVISSITMFNPEIKIFDVDVKEWQNQLVLYCFPNDTGHLISVEFCNWVGYLYFVCVHFLMLAYVKIRYE